MKYAALSLSCMSCETSTDNPWRLVTPSGILLRRISPCSLSVFNVTHLHQRNNFSECPVAEFLTTFLPLSESHRKLRKSTRTGGKNHTRCLRDDFRILRNHCRETQHVPLRAGLELEWCQTSVVELRSTIMCV